MVRVSVVIPVYNIEAHLRQCLDSVAAQTLDDIEVLCVDDGSTDQSPAILAEYAAKDPRFRVIPQENGGPGVARNTGMTQATGEYLIFLDSDDWFEPDFLMTMLTRAETAGADVTVCRAREFDTATGQDLPSEWMLQLDGLPEELVFSPREIAPHLFRFTWGWPWDKLYRREYLRKEGLCYPPLPNSEDLSFVFLSLAAAGKIAVVDKLLVHHRVNRGASVSNSRQRHPEAPYQAIKLLEAGLKEKGLYPVFEMSFLDWSLGFLVWNVASMEDPQVRKTSYAQLRREWLPAFPFLEHPAKDYSTVNYLKFQLARFAPRFVFYGVVKGYHRWKNRKEGR